MENQDGTLLPRLERLRIKEKWLDALKSGEYRQTTGGLREPIYDNNKPTEEFAYCCLGVLCEVSGLGEFDEYNNFSGLAEEASCSVTVPDLIASNLGLENEHQRMLYRLNDNHRFSFEQIAAVIETNDDILGVYLPT